MIRPHASRSPHPLSFRSLRTVASAAFTTALAFVATTASAATYTVTSLAALQTQINSAVPGDTIVVADGIYTATASIAINRVGTAANPILIAAETIGGVEIRGTRGFTFSSPAAYVTVQGFKLTHATGIGIPSGTRFCRLSRNLIELTIPAGSDVSYINISGDDVEIDRNELRNKSTLGEMLDIAGSGSQVARRLWVHHNYFHDFKSPGGNGAETIRWGLSGLSLSTGNGLCEYNLFVRCNGENEMISNKSSGNTYRYNTVLDSPGGEISQRHGNDCRYYGNYMRNTSGIRVYGDRHQIFSNYLEGNAIAINMGNGDGDIYNGALLTAHDRPDDNVVTFNTLVNNTANYEMGGRTGGLGATNTTFANNLIVGGGPAASISTSAPYTNPVWAGNLSWNTTGPGALPAGTYTNADPLLAKDADGVYHLQPGSPAIDRAVGSYPAVTFDLDGQPRTAPLDVGADEFSSAAVTARLLTPADVGPNSGLTPTPTSPAAAPVFSHVSGTYSGPQYVSLTSPTPGANLRFTTDGSTPTATTGTAYTGVLTISSTVTLRAIAAQTGVADSAVTTATFTIDATAPRPGRLANLSARGQVAAGGALTPGFVVRGTGTKTLLIRAVGPTLAAFGLTTALTDTKLELIPGGASAPLQSNDDWAANSGTTSAALASVMASVGAFALAPAAKDSAVLPTLAPGSYSVRIAPAGTATSGLALAEVYDADPAGSPIRLVNLSTLGLVGTGDQVLTAGFVIDGSQPKQLLIRAIGPGLAAFGVGELLADPQFSVLPLGGTTPVATNNDWGSGPAATALSELFAKAGAFALVPGSKDAALIVQLPPGGYSVAVSGIAATSGQALVELYDLDP